MRDTPEQAAAWRHAHALRKYERNGVIYISSPEVKQHTCCDCAALEFEGNALDCGGFPPSLSDDDEFGCKGAIWIKSPETPA